ncbi:unnamed protein product [Urochloa humidicola]
MDNPTRPLSILSWNVRGLGDRLKCNNVRLAIHTHPTLVCFQETKLTSIDNFKAATFLPQPLASSFTYLPSLGASGGVLTAWDLAVLSLTSSTLHQYSLTTTFQATAFDLAFTVTNCYAPCLPAEKPSFLQELSTVSSLVCGAWVLLGDFNMTHDTVSFGMLQ